MGLRSVLVRRAALVVVVLLVLGAAAGCGHSETFTFTMLSCNMFPALRPGDVVTGSSPRKLERGDIVTFLPPAGARRSERDVRVSRIVGLPGEHIEGGGGGVFVNGKPLDETYLKRMVETRPFDAATIPADSYWVLGDNRANSADSRAFGAVAKGDVRTRTVRVDKGNPKADAPDCA